MGEEPPRTTAAHDIKDAVQDLALGVGLRPAAGLGLGDIGLDQLPLCIRDVGRVRRSRVHALKGSRS
jgi:hypothetical protein